MGITELWNVLFLAPMLNSLIVLNRFLFNNFGITILIFTLIVRLLILPLTLKQLRASKAMMTLQPKMQELQKKYAKDRQRLSQETMKLYKEQGVNPLGCAVPTLVQFPIWIGLYQSIIQALADTPEALLGLSQHLYPLAIVHETVPLQNRFLWLNLARPDPTFFVLPVLVGVSMWVQQKMITTPAMDPRQASMNKMMQVWMPVMFGFFTLQFASGLALYWFVSNVIGIVMQYFVTGWGTLFTSVPAPAAVTAKAPAKERKAVVNGKPRSKRKDSRRGR